MSAAPGYSYWLPLPVGALREAFRAPLEFQFRARKRFGDVVRLQVGPYATHFLYHPDYVSRVLRENQKNYLRGWQYNLLRQLFGENLVVSEGAYWLRQRRLAQPAFAPQQLAGYADAMIDAIENLIAHLRDSSESMQGLDVGQTMSKLALAIAGRTLFSRDVSRDADAVGTAFGTVSRFLDFRFKHPLTSPPMFLPTARNLRFKAARNCLYEVVLTMIRQRRDQESDRSDLLSMLMAARDEETGDQMTEEQLCVEALTFLIAGHETTAKALAWMFYLLASHRPIREQLYEEARCVFAGRRPTASDVFRLKATRMAVEESLRLYPPVWVLARQAVNEDEIGGYRIPKKSMVVLSPFVTHRHPEFWEHSEAFTPERFSPAEAAKRPKGAYFPFIAGPHQCIGHEFAMMEMCLVVAMILQHFDFESLSGSTIYPVAALTLNPSGPIRIALKCREA